MSPVKFTKFGKAKDAVPVNDTPVSRLSKILSKTSFDETSGFVPAAVSNHFTTPTYEYPVIRCIDVTPGGIPADLDESANQEPPIRQFTPFFDEPDGFMSVASKSVLTGEYSNASSGYYSCSTTQSAPPTCTVKNDIDAPSHKATLTNSGFLNHEKLRKLVTSESPAVHSLTLRRANSCTTRGWLAKRARKQTWPCITGISRSNSLITPALFDTNSCPPVICNSFRINQMSVTARASLPPVGEYGSSPSSVDSPTSVPVGFEDMSCSPGHVRTLDDSLDNSLRPQAKKLRMDEASSSDENGPLGAEYKMCVDSTLPIEDKCTSDVDDIPAHCLQNNVHPKLPFDMARHHSTPMMCFRNRNPIANFMLPSPTPTDSHESSKPLSRSSSVPVPAIAEKLSRCISVLDNPNVRCDGRRSRALPVISRTGSGLHCISVDTVAELISASSERRNINFIIVDCRFPYEYQGGHIQGAINVYTHSDMVLEVFNRVPAQRPPGVPEPPKLLGESLQRRLAMAPKEPMSAPCEAFSDDEDDDSDDDDDFGHFTSDDSQLELAAAAAMAAAERENEDIPLETELSASSSESCHSLGFTGSQDPAFVVIFHCEFSSQRAPELATFLRSIDRLSNYHRYPFLHFPEIYIMKGGYAAFVDKYFHLCVPQTYMKMNDHAFRSEFRFYRRLTKRVRSSCMACIRPQHKIMEQSMIDGSIGPQSSLTESCPAESSSLVVTEQDSEKPERNPALTEALSDDKENRSPNEHVRQKSSQSPMSELAVESPASRRVSQGHSSAEESPSTGVVNIGEQIVRAGRRTTNATLASAGSSIPIPFHHFGPPTQELLTEKMSQLNRPGLCEPLKRSISDIGHCYKNDKPKRLIAPILNPFSMNDSGGLQLTPAMGRKRATISGRFSTLQAATTSTETPVLSRALKAHLSPSNRD